MIKNKDTYKELAEVASKDGYYLVKKTLMEKYWNLIDYERSEKERQRRRAEMWKSRFEQLKKEVKDAKP